MKSTTGQHFIALDQVRALAAFMVFAWHFLHGSQGQPLPFHILPALPFLDEGHSGVSLFMALSGYLFASLLEGRAVSAPRFLFNRALRLLPLLALVLAIHGALLLASGERLGPYLASLAQDLWLPTLPNGGWSLTVEFHFYLLLPALLWLFRRSRFLPLALVAAAILARAALWRAQGEVQQLAFWTLVGRLDQFVLGMAAFHFRGLMAGKHLRALAILGSFWIFYAWFDWSGGFYQRPSYPSPSPLWIFLPSLEGLAYGAGIAWYAESFRHPKGGLSGFVGKLGEYSYSIYLLHFFVVFPLAAWIHFKVAPIDAPWKGLFWATLGYLAMAPLGWLSYRFVESPFLRLRKNYLGEPL
jgi:peptidoglycan/LPS O-acetylase OafA/YrhL